MKRIIRTLAHYSRGLLYYIFYYLPYKLFFFPSLQGSKIKTIRINDVSYKLRLTPALGGISEDLCINPIREYPNVYYFKKYLEKYSRTVETYMGIGANIGYYAILTSKVLGQTGERRNIFALEPVHNTFERLKYNLELNKVKNVRAFNIGIGDKDSRANMVIMKQHNLSKVQDDTIPSGFEKGKIEKVQLYSLTTLFAKYNILKRNILFRMDIEGYEYNVITGNLDLLKKLKNAHIIMEFHAFFLHSEKSVTLLRSLQSAGYNLQQVISCEPAYFLRMPKLIRKLLTSLFLFQYNGEALGKIERYRTIDDLITDFRDEHNALYVYPHLHFYFAKP